MWRNEGQRSASVPALECIFCTTIENTNCLSHLPIDFLLVVKVFPVIYILYFILQVKKICTPFFPFKISCNCSGHCFRISCTKPILSIPFCHKAFTSYCNFFATSLFHSVSLPYAAFTSPVNTISIVTPFLSCQISFLLFTAFTL